MKELPCKQCIITPICRDKTLNQLFHDCSLVSKYIAEAEDRSTYEEGNVRRQLIYDYLKPKKWTLQKRAHYDYTFMRSGRLGI